jgi:hypothetical protein
LYDRLPEITVPGILVAEHQSAAIRSNQGSVEPGEYDDGLETAELLVREPAEGQIETVFLGFGRIHNVYLVWSYLIGCGVILTPCGECYVNSARCPDYF